MSRLAHKSTFLLLLVALGGLSIGLLHQHLVHGNDGHHDFSPLATYNMPDSFNQLVTESDLIVIGRFSDIREIDSSFYGFGENAANLRELDKTNTNIPSGLPVVYFDLHVGDVLSASNQGIDQQVTILIDSGESSVRKRYGEGSFVWFLQQNPDGTFGLWTPLSAARITEDRALEWALETELDGTLVLPETLTELTSALGNLK